MILNNWSISRRTCSFRLSLLWVEMVKHRWSRLCSIFLMEEQHYKLYFEYIFPCCVCLIFISSSLFTNVRNLCHKFQFSSRKFSILKLLIFKCKKFLWCLHLNNFFCKPPTTEITMTTWEMVNYFQPSDEENFDHQKLLRAH